jgi:hypothetical protein
MAERRPRRRAWPSPHSAVTGTLAHPRCEPVVQPSLARPLGDNERAVASVPNSRVAEPPPLLEGGAGNAVGFDVEHDPDGSSRRRRTSRAAVRRSPVTLSKRATSSCQTAGASNGTEPEERGGDAGYRVGFGGCSADPLRVADSSDDIHEKRQPQEPPRPIEPTRPYISSKARPRDNGPASGK